MTEERHTPSPQKAHNHRAVSTQLTCHRCRRLAQTGGRIVGSPCTRLQPGKQKRFSEKGVYYAKRLQHLKHKGTASPEDQSTSRVCDNGTRNAFSAAHDGVSPMTQSIQWPTHKLRIFISGI